MKIKDILKGIRPEFLIMMVILFLLFYKINTDQFLTNTGALTIGPGGDFIVIHDREHAERLIKEGRALANFNPNTCRIIAVYDVNMDNIWKISFVDHPETLYSDDIYPENVRSGESRNGEFYFTASDGVYVRTSYRWNTTKNGNDYLIVYTTDTRQEKVTSRQTIVLYVIVTLCFIMLVNVFYWQLHSVTNKYRKVMLRDSKRSIL